MEERNEDIVREGGLHLACQCHFSKDADPEEERRGEGGGEEGREKKASRNLKLDLRGCE